MAASPAEKRGEHAMVRVLDQRRVQLGIPVAHVHNVHLQGRQGKRNRVKGEKEAVVDRGAEPPGLRSVRLTHIAARRGAELKQQQQQEEEAEQGGHGQRRHHQAPRER